MAMSKEVGGGATRGVGGISGAGGKNVNPVYKEINTSVKRPTEKQLLKHYRELFKQWNH